MNEQDRADLAKELIAEIAAAWGDGSCIVKSEQDGAPVFIVSVNRGSKFIFNPQESAEEIVKQVESNLTLAFKDKTPEAIKDAIRLHSFMRIGTLIACTPVNFADFLWMQRLLTDAHVTSHETGNFSPEIKKGLSLSVLSMIDARLRERLKLEEASLGLLYDEQPLGAKRVVNDYLALEAIESLGGFPSRNKLAKALEVAPGTILNWARSRGFDSLEELLSSLRKTKTDNSEA
jgi:hypothetical protein